MSSTGQQRTRSVRIGSVTVGDGPAVVIVGAAGREGAADGRWLSLRGRHAPGDATATGPGPAAIGHHAGAGPGAGAIAEARSAWDGPLLVEPGAAGDLPAIAEHADGVVIGSEWTGDLPLVRAAARLGLPVVVHRGHGSALDDWLRVADQCVAEGNDAVVLCEGAAGTDGATAAVDLALLRAARERTGRPVLAALGEDAGLAGAVVAAGADGVWLAAEAGAEAVAAARDAVTVIGALVRREGPRTVAAAREAIDRTDAALAVLLERRAALAGVVQRLKPVGGFAGRDMERERRLVAAMARHAPRLGEARLAPIMNAVIEAGLRLAEAGGDSGGNERENGHKPSCEGDRLGLKGVEALAGRGLDHD
jgi:chorismate mutase